MKIRFCYTRGWKYTFGDDSFGPAVIDFLNKKYSELLKDRAFVIDVGTGMSDFLFDILLSPIKPKKLIVLIVIDSIISPSRSAGELLEIQPNQLSSEKAPLFFLHQFPSVNLLKELKEETGVEVCVFVVQAKRIPKEVNSGLFLEVRKVIPCMCKRILKECVVY